MSIGVEYSYLQFFSAQSAVGPAPQRGKRMRDENVWHLHPINPQIEMPSVFTMSGMYKVKTVVCK